MGFRVGGCFASHVWLVQGKRRLALSMLEGLWLGGSSVFCWVECCMWGFKRASI